MQFATCGAASDEMTLAWWQLQVFSAQLTLEYFRDKDRQILQMFHYIDVIMSAMASQITSLTIVYSTVYWGADQTKHQSSASLAFVRGIHRSPANSPHKWPVTRKMFPFDDVIMCIFRLYLQSLAERGSPAQPDVVPTEVEVLECGVDSHGGTNELSPVLPQLITTEVQYPYTGVSLEVQAAILNQMQIITVMYICRLNRGGVWFIQVLTSTTVNFNDGWA